MNHELLKFKIGSAVIEFERVEEHYNIGVRVKDPLCVDESSREKYLGVSCTGKVFNDFLRELSNIPKQREGFNE